MALPARVNGKSVYLLVSVDDENVPRIAEADMVERALQPTGVHYTAYVTSAAASAVDG